MTVAKKRGIRGDIYRDITDILRTGSYNILQISEQTGTNWETVKNAVLTLQKIGIVSSKEEETRTLYYVDESKLINLRNDTLLGLPLKEEQEQITKALFNRIIERWDALNINRSLNKTFLQKMLIKLVKSEKIADVPYGWYIFGECAVLQCDPLNGFDSKFSFSKKYDAAIDKIILDFSQIPDTKELLLKSYSEEGNELYLLRLRISELLKDRFIAESIESLKKNLRLFLFSFRKTEENGDLIEFLNGFASIFIRLANGLTIQQLEDLREDINASFMSVWELVGTYEFFESLVTHNYYDKSFLRKYYQLRIENLKQTADCYLSTLQEFCPELVPITDPLRRFKGIQAK
jgi:hypothetical protein